MRPWISCLTLSLILRSSSERSSSSERGEPVPSPNPVSALVAASTVRPGSRPRCWASLGWNVGDYGSVVASFRPTVTTVLGLDRQRAQRALFIGVQIAVLLVVLSRLATSSWELPVGLVLVAILGTATVGWIWLYLTNSSIA